MFTLLRHGGLRRTLISETPGFVTSLVIAEWLFKFHSFTLECLAFMATWFVLGAGIAWARKFIGRPRPLAHG